MAWRMLMIAEGHCYGRERKASTLIHFFKQATLILVAM